MEEVISTFGDTIVQSYNLLLSVLPQFLAFSLNLFLLIILVVIYSIFIWKFYTFVSKKNILELNLNQYNKYEHPFLIKITAGFFYLLEYIIILPFLIFFWFAIFTLFLIILATNIEIPQILLISATVIAAIRVIAYYKEEVSNEVAKFLPITLLAIAIINPLFFTKGFIERIFEQLAQIPNLLNPIIYYLGFIIILEVILRFFDFIFSLFGIEEED